MGATSQSKLKFEDYDGFVEKFKPKKTTDDCYTPPEIYDVVADYVTERFGIDRADMVRPFYPGGDFESFDYPDGCCVVDNPPFSILQRIKRFYRDNGIKFFIFAPSLTAFSGALTTEFTHIICDANITYANGAVVRTAFVTNMGGDIVAESCPELGDRINAKMDEIKSRTTKKLPKYEYPDEVLDLREAPVVRGASHAVPSAALRLHPHKQARSAGRQGHLRRRAAAERASRSRASRSRASRSRASRSRASRSRASHNPQMGAVGARARDGSRAVQTR